MKASDQSLQEDRDEWLGWSADERKRVHVVSVSGNHFTMMKQPLVQSLSEQVQQAGIVLQNRTQIEIAGTGEDKNV